MSKKNTRLIVVLLLLLIIGAYIYATKTPQTQEVTTENDSQRTVATTTTTETPTQPTGCDFTLDTSFIKNAKEVTETRQGDDNHITKRFYMQTQDSNFIKIAKSEPGSEVLKADGKYYFQFTALMSTPKDVWDAEVQASRSTCKTGGMEICLWELKENTSYTQKGSCIFKSESIGNSTDMPADLMDVLNPTHNPSIRIDLSVSETFAHIVQK